MNLLSIYNINDDVYLHNVYMQNINIKENCKTFCLQMLLLKLHSEK